MNIEYRDKLTQMVHNQGNSHSIYAVDNDPGFSTFFNDNPHEYPEAPSQFELKEEAYFELRVEEGPSCVFQTEIAPEETHEHTKPIFLMEGGKDEQLFNQSQPIEKLGVCNEELNNK